MDMKQTVLNNPILAILRNIPDDKLLKYAETIINGGVKFFEVALNSKNALSQIELLKKTFGNDALIGAGTAITPERAKSAIESGASFLLSPSTDEAVLEYCRDNKIAFMPGALTPSDVSLCVRYGFNVIKLFPAGDMPMSYVKSLKGPFDETDYVAIGGVNGNNIREFTDNGYIGVGIGSGIIPSEFVQNERWSEASKYIENMLKSLK